MNETKTTRNSRHADPDHRVITDRVGAEDCVENCIIIQRMASVFST